MAGQRYNRTGTAVRPYCPKWTGVGMAGPFAFEVARSGFGGPECSEDFQPVVPIPLTNRTRPMFDNARAKLQPVADIPRNVQILVAFSAFTMVVCVATLLVVLAGNVGKVSK